MPLATLFRRTVLVLLFLWVALSGVLVAIMGPKGRAVGIAAVAAGGGGLAVFGGVLVLLLPRILPQIVANSVARKERFLVSGISVGHTSIERETNGAGRWILTNRKADGPWIRLAAQDDADDVAARLIRVWRTVPITLGLVVLAIPPLALVAIGRLADSPLYDVARLSFLIYLLNGVYLFAVTVRPDRSPRSIIRELKKETLLGRRYALGVVLDGYGRRHVRPRDQDPERFEPVGEWLREVPTAHGLRYLYLRHLMDTDRADELQTQRVALLGLESHFRSGQSGPYGPAVLWYAAYLAETAEEAERVWGWIEPLPPQQAPGEAWLQARIAALRGEATEARRLAEEARAGYLASAEDAETRCAYELDHIGRIATGLPADSPA